MINNSEHDPLGLIEKNLYSSIYGSLEIQDLARLASVCRFFRDRLQLPLSQYRRRLHDIFPEQLLRATIFKAYPIPYRWLLDLIGPMRYDVKGFFSNVNDGRWQLAGLCGLEAAVTELLGDAIHTTKDRIGFGVMHYYALGGHIELLQQHIQCHCSNFTAADDPNYLLLRLAILGNHASLVTLLLEQYHYDPDYKVNAKESLLHFAAKGGSLELAKLLIARKVDPKYGVCLATLAMEGGHFQLCDYFMEQGLDPLSSETKRYAYIIQCVNYGRLARALKVIADYHIDPKKIHANNMNLLTAAAQGGQLELVQYFIEQGWFKASDSFRNGANMLHEAAMNGQTDFIFDAVEKFQLDVLSKSFHGNTVLHYSAMHGDWSKFCLIRERYFSEQLLVANDAGNTIAHIAALNGRLEFLENYVNEFGSECLRVENKRNKNVLQLACTSNNPDLVLWLVQTQGFSEDELHEILTKHDPNNFLSDQAISQLLEHNNYSTGCGHGNK